MIFFICWQAQWIYKLQIKQCTDIHQVRMRKKKIPKTKKYINALQQEPTDNEIDGITSVKLYMKPWDVSIHF